MTQNETTSASRADLHCHSTASLISKLGVSRALGLPECATPPEEAYELAKRRGMDFVTLTDHDVIDGAVELAERYADAFVSVELTAWLRGTEQAVHVLCWGITPEQHEELQRLAGDVEDVAAFLAERDIACALAHPFFNVGAPLLPRQRRRLAELFGAWEVRNGARARELNLPAAIYIDTHGGTPTAGSDDHAGIDIGRTWTATPRAAGWREFLDHIRAGRTTVGGDEGSAAKWAHAALAIAVRTLGRATGGTPDPAAVLRMAERVLETGDHVGANLAPEDARALVGAWLDAVGIDEDPVALMQQDGFSHTAFARRVRRVHERSLRAAAESPLDGRLPVRVFEACLPAVPYAPAAAFLGREKHRLARADGGPVRVAVVADGIGTTHGVARTLEQVSDRGVPGFEVELVGTDSAVDRRLPSVAEVDLGDVAVGVPCLPAVVEALADGRYDLVHVTVPGPAGIAAALTARIMGLPLVGSYHSELARYAGLRTGDARAGMAVTAVLAAFYGRCDRVLSPSTAADAALSGLGIAAERIGRWDRGVDVSRFGPQHRAARDDDRIDVLYAGRLAAEKDIGLLAEAVLVARRRDPRIRLVIAGGGAEEGLLRARLGDHVEVLGWLEGDALARAYASADLFCFCSQTDTFGQVVLEAQASGLPVVAVAAGGPAELVEDGRSGVLCPPDAAAIGGALAGLAASPRLRSSLSRGGLAAVAERTWERSLAQLGAGWAETARREARRAA